jgi:hypothetical protein
MKLFKKKNKKDDSNIAETKVRIEVVRLLGGAVPYTIAKFEALQTADSDNNLILVDEANSFKDDVDIVKHKIIADLQDILELHKKPIEERIKLVKERIEKQQRLISSIKDGYIEREVEKEGKRVKEKVRVNKIDEDVKLREYTALLDVLSNDGDGSYETIDSDGLKRIFYLYKEGILIPYKWITAKTTLYPDISTKRKLYKENQDLIDQDFFNDNKGFFSGWKKYAGVAILLIWMISLIYFSVNLNRSYAEFDDRKAEEYSTKCAYWCTNIHTETQTFINAYNNMISEKEDSDLIKIG